MRTVNVQIKHTWTPDELAANVADHINECHKKIQLLENDFSQDIDPLLYFESCLADLSEATECARFMRFVHHDEQVRAESTQAQKNYDEFLITLFARKELYDILSTKHERGVLEQRMADKILDDFCRSGTALPEQERNAVRDLLKKHSVLCTEFKANLDRNTDTVAINEEELDGVPLSLKARLPKIKNTKDETQNHYLLTLNHADVPPLLQYAKRPDVRKKVFLAYENREAKENTQLLTQAIEHDDARPAARRRNRMATRTLE